MRTCRLAVLTAEHSAISIEDEVAVTELFELRLQLRRVSHELQAIVARPECVASRSITLPFILGELNYCFSSY